MPSSPLTLGQIMGLVAVVALAFAAAPAPLAIAFSLVLTFAVGCAAIFRMPWTRIASWAFACYPFFSLLMLYATWGAAWYTLGRPPRSSMDDPKYIGPLVDAPYIVTGVLLLGLFPALAVNAALIALEFIRMLHDDRDDLKRFMARLALPLISWPLAIFWFKADPGRVVDWFFRLGDSLREGIRRSRGQILEAAVMV